MAKRRTRKKRQSAKRPFLTDNYLASTKRLSGQKAPVGKPVKRQITIKAQVESRPGFKKKKAQQAERSVAWEPVKKNIFRSVGLAALIFGIETVLYFALK